jgi:hypothetical protein
MPLAWPADLKSPSRQKPGQSHGFQAKPGQNITSATHSKFESSGLPDQKVWIWDISFPSDPTNVLSLHSEWKDGFQLDRMDSLDIFPSFWTVTFYPFGRFALGMEK